MVIADNQLTVSVPEVWYKTMKSAKKFHYSEIKCHIMSKAHCSQDNSNIIETPQKCVPFVNF